MRLPTSLQIDLHKTDEDRYQAALFAPADKRPALFALYAFHHEVARVAESAREPMMHAIRLQWWREAVEGAREGKPRQHQTVTALADLFAQHDLPMELFEAIIDAREHDVAGHVFEDIEALEAYADATAGNLMRLAARVLGEPHDDLAREAGIAQALTGLLRAIPFHAALNKVYLPQRLIDECATTREDILRDHPGLVINPAVDILARVAHGHFVQARELAKPGTALPAFLPAAPTPLYLKRIAARDFDVFRTPVDIPLYRRQFAILRASWRGKI